VAGDAVRALGGVSDRNRNELLDLFVKFSRREYLFTEGIPGFVCFGGASSRRLREIADGGAGKAVC